MRLLGKAGAATRGEAVMQVRKTFDGITAPEFSRAFSIAALLVIVWAGWPEAARAQDVFNSHYRVYAILARSGSGTATDPWRPQYLPNVKVKDSPGIKALGRGAGRTPRTSFSPVPFSLLSAPLPSPTSFSMSAGRITGADTSKIEFIECGPQIVSQGEMNPVEKRLFRFGEFIAWMRSAGETPNANPLR